MSPLYFRPESVGRALERWTISVSAYPGVSSVHVYCAVWFGLWSVFQVSSLHILEIVVLPLLSDNSWYINIKCSVACVPGTFAQVWLFFPMYLNFLVKCHIKFIFVCPRFWHFCDIFKMTFLVPHFKDYCISFRFKNKNCLVQFFEVWKSTKEGICEIYFMKFFIVLNLFEETRFSLWSYWSHDRYFFFLFFF